MKPHLAIYRRFTDKVAELGFTRDRTAWWKRRCGPIIQGIHLHKFSYTTSYRVHAVIHLVDFDSPDAPWLNGIASYDGWYQPPHRIIHFRPLDGIAPDRRYSFDFTESSGSWQPCADELFAFTRDVLIPWFDRWTDVGRLLKDTHSPLTHDQKKFLGRT